MSQTLALLMRGFSERNADLLTDVYSEDADWINAFGSRKRGVAESVTYLRGLFKDENFNEGELVAPPEISLRILNADTAVVSGHLRIKGQRLLNGTLLERDNHSIRILQRQTNGSWVIVSRCTWTPTPSSPTAATPDARRRIPVLSPAKSSMPLRGEHCNLAL